MYKKYMHSGDRRINPEPVNEGLISWAKGKIDNFKKAREEKKRLDAEKKANKEAEKAAAAKARIENIEKADRAKGRKLNHEQAYKKAVELANKLINSAKFKELKRFFSNDYYTWIENEWELNEWNTYEMTSCLTSDFSFNNVRSEAEENYYKNKYREFVKALNDAFQKVDKTYAIKEYLDDCYATELNDLI